ncbi:MAG: hypothetical protein K9K21_04855 [Desulfotignum sp.]|nr:hypothetical protein [Desulfotignum sp.]MCF8113168.1 hypothetical protein [Desulfotignum sp.]
MAHQDKGHYAGKHPDRKIDPVIAEKLNTLIKQNRLSCAAAHKAAADLKVSPEQIGIQADLMEVRIVKCQLGLFGYEPEPKRIDPGIDISDDLWAHIENKSVDGRLSCKTCWNIAQKFAVSRLEMGSACEKINIRIKPCQLGAF